MACKKCNKNYKTLTKDGYCACCSKDINGIWPIEFQENNQKKKK